MRRRRLWGSWTATLAAAVAVVVTLAITVTVAVVVAMSVTATAGGLAGHANAAARRSSQPAVADRPPMDPHPSAPGIIVPSRLDESDPVLYRMEGRYFLFTSGIPGLPPVDVPATSTVDFGTWSPVTDALPTLPRWAVPGYTWAPDLHLFGSTFVLYFTAMLRGTSPAMECIGDAVGSAPDGPFRPSSNPLICQEDQGGSIDPRVFTGPRGTEWMLWKSDQNIAGSNTPTRLWSQQLTSDGLGLIGKASELMGPDEQWQGTIVEAPDMVDIGNTFWLFYSGNWFNEADYAIGAARCRGPAGPCADISPFPLLASNAQGAGPGEESVFEDPDGVWMLYSPWHSSIPLVQVPPRPVMITRIGFGPHGPYLGAGSTPPGIPALGAAPLWGDPAK